MSALVALQVLEPWPSSLYHMRQSPSGLLNTHASMQLLLDSFSGPTRVQLSRSSLTKCVIVRATFQCVGTPVI
ncbi:hypothetical protein D3C87_1882680 [compost metagenome]